MQDRHLVVKRSERLRLGIEFLQPRLQHAGVIVGASHEWSVAIRANWTLGELGAGRTRGETASATLQSAGYSVAHSLLRYFQPNGEIERGAQPFQNRFQTLRLWKSSRKTIKDKTACAVQTKPIFDE